jgi:DegV family protein with EDD domain
LLDLFEDAKASGDEAVYITISSGISGTYQTACMTRDLADYDGAYVLDSQNATGGQRMLVEYAVRLRDQGKSAAEIVAGVEKLREKIVLYACIDTLEYLYKGGRISQTAYKLGTLAQVKPVIRVSPEGKIEVPSKAMGMRKGIDLLIKRLETQKPDPGHPIYVMFTPETDNAKMLLERVRAAGYDVPDHRLISVGAAIGSHIGHNGCGIVYAEE